MRIVLTGASGFLGKAIRSQLAEFDIVSIGRSSNCTLICDLAEQTPQIDGEVDYVIHAAGKAHIVPKTAAEAEDFFRVNVGGTKRLLESLLGKSLKGFVFISTVAVYGKERGVELSEEEPMNGQSPYALSKIEAEQMILNFGRSHKIPVLILRLPLLIGKNAPGNYGAMVKAIRKGYYFRIGSGEARRSMISAASIASALTSFLGKQGIYNLTDGVHPSLAKLDEAIATKLRRKVRKIPQRLAAILAKIGDRIPGFPFNSLRFEKLNSELTFCDRKARHELGWAPDPVLSILDI